MLVDVGAKASCLAHVANSDVASIVAELFLLMMLLMRLLLAPVMQFAMFLLQSL